MNLFKRIIYSWVVKSRYILMLSVVMSFALASITFFQKQPKHYVAKVYGCTSLLNYQSMFDYFTPVSIALKEGNKEIATRYLSLKPSDIKNLSEITLVHVNQIVEEADIRYEFVIAASFIDDTSGAAKLQDAIVKYIANNSLLITKCTEKTKAFAQDKMILKEEINRVDSLLKTFKDQNTVYYENLRQRKVDLSLQLNKYAEKYDEFYDLKIFYGFDKTGQWESDDSKWLKMLLYYLVGLGFVSFVISIVRDKDLVSDIKKHLTEGGWV